MRRAVVAVLLVAMPTNVVAQPSATRAEAPGRSEVGSAMLRAQEALRRCTPPLRGVVHVFVTFGRDGRVRNAAFGLISERETRRVDMSFLPEAASAVPLNARPGFARSSVGRCVLAEVGRVTVAAFTRPEFVVLYSYAL
ncbi:MAG: hypothetical protein JNK05_38020 [Myxococcales bacterium]|nr:hypothetical protein [Myxococcales bacterium]